MSEKSEMILVDGNCLRRRGGRRPWAAATFGKKFLCRKNIHQPYLSSQYLVAEEKR